LLVGLDVLLEEHYVAVLAWDGLVQAVLLVGEEEATRDEGTAALVGAIDEGLWAHAPVFVD